LPSDALTWLLRFGQKKSFTSGEWADFCEQAFVFAATAGPNGQQTMVGSGDITVVGHLGDSEPRMAIGPSSFSSDELTAVHGDIRKILTQLLAAMTRRRHVELFVPSVGIRMRTQFGRDARLGRPRLHYEGTRENQFLAVAIHLLHDRWEDLRLCRRAGCETLFVPVRRQIFCSVDCSRQEQWSKFAAKHPKRRRDYRAEYVKRVQRRTSPRIKVKTRHKKEPH
jgi:hypothetical protein